MNGNTYTSLTSLARPGSQSGLAGRVWAILVALAMFTAACGGTAAADPSGPEAGPPPDDPNAEQETSAPAADEAADANVSPSLEPTTKILEGSYDVLGRSADPTPLAIVNGLLIDGTGSEPIPNAALVIEQGIIAAVGPRDQIDIPEDAIVVDAQGGAILPGFIDAHTHVLDSLPLEDGMISEVNRTVYLTMPLEAGLTTVRDLGSHYSSAEEIEALRTQLHQYGNSAPRILLTGPLLSVTGSWARASFQSQSLVPPIDTIEDARVVTEALLAAGVDQIKILDDPGPGDPGPTLTQQQFTAIVEAAHAKGVWVTSHSAGTETLKALASGVDELAHWPPTSRPGFPPEPLPEGVLDQMIEAEIAIVSTFNVTKPTPDELRRFLDAGGTIAMGTDGPPAGPLDRFTRELDVMLIFGMTPMEVIVASTAHSAYVLGLSDHLGTLEPGKLADVIVVPGNPLEDMAAMRNVQVVIRGGELVFQDPEFMTE